MHGPHLNSSRYKVIILIINISVLIHLATPAVTGSSLMPQQTVLAQLLGYVFMHCF